MSIKTRRDSSHKRYYKNKGAGYCVSCNIKIPKNREGKIHCKIFSVTNNYQHRLLDLDRRITFLEREHDKKVGITK